MKSVHLFELDIIIMISFQWYGNCRNNFSPFFLQRAIKFYYNCSVVYAYNKTKIIPWYGFISEPYILLWINNKTIISQYKINFIKNLKKKHAFGEGKGGMVLHGAHVNNSNSALNVHSKNRKKLMKVCKVIENHLKKIESSIRKHENDIK